jgi:hypothetical protein
VLSHGKGPLSFHDHAGRQCVLILSPREQFELDHVSCLGLLVGVCDSNLEIWGVVLMVGRVLW